MDNGNIKEKFERFCLAWPLQEKYYVWGAGNSARKFCARMGDKLQICGFIDSDPEKWGAQFLGRRIFQPDECLGSQHEKRIVIASAAYLDITEELEKRGLVNGLDFCDSRMFEGIHIWNAENKVHIRRTDLAITSFCNLKCKNCNMLIPYFECPRHKSLEEILGDLDVYFQWVDHVDTINLLGGEPFLHPQVMEITQAVVERYREKMDDLVFFTNGTVIPKEDMLRYMSEQDIVVQISDYRKGVAAVGEKIEAFAKALDSHGVSYRWEKMDFWLDNEAHSDRSGWSREDCAAFCARCNPPFRGLQDKKFYYCHLSASAKLSGRFSEDPGDYFDLSEPERGRKIELAAFDLGHLPKGSVSYCRYCGGCSSVNQNRIAVAQQLRQINY